MDTPLFSSAAFLVLLLGPAPPWFVLSALSGVVAASAFFVVLGRGFRSLPIYLVLGLLAAPVWQVLTADLPQLPAPLSIGEVHFLVVMAGTWGLLAIARVLKL